MADAELKFIYSLLTANRHEQNLFHAQQIPKGIFKRRPVEIDWVYRHKENFGEYPSRSKFEQKFNTKLPFCRDSLRSSLQPILDLSMFHQMRKAQVKVKDLLDKGRPLKEALSVFKLEAERLRSYDSQYVDVNSGDSGLATNRYNQRKQQRLTGKQIDSPWKSLNKLAHFFSPGELITIAARLGMGKTWITLYWANYWAEKGEKVLIISEEMPSEQVNDRLHCVRFKLPYDEFRVGKLSPQTKRKWQAAKLFARSKKYDVIITSDSGSVSGLAHLESKINEYKPTVVIIDGAYLIEPEGVPTQAKHNERMAFLTKRLKKLALRTKSVVVSIIQMNRQAEQKDGVTKGSVGSVFGSDTWAQDSDWLIDISGKRGSNRRTISLLKGRESNIGEFWIKYELDRKPDFSEVSGNVNHTTSAGKLSFKGLA